MSSYLSNLLTNTTSKYNSLRRSLLSSEDDGDTEDDTHICRVLRAYYQEKGRPSPPWLPSDPHEKRAITPQPYAQQSAYPTNPGGRGQNGNNQNQAGQRGSLSDLWDTPSAQQSSGPMQPQSLRAARRPAGGPPPGASSSLAPPQARPLPSQRAGSYQSVSSQQSSGRPGSRVAAEPSPPSSSGGQAAGTAQERLKARLWGGARTGSSASGNYQGGGGASNGYEEPQMSANAPWSSGGNPYDTGGRYGR